MSWFFPFEASSVGKLCARSRVGAITNIAGPFSHPYVELTVCCFARHDWQWLFILWKGWLSFTNKTRRIIYFKGLLMTQLKLRSNSVSTIATGKNKHPQSSNRQSHDFSSWYCKNFTGSMDRDDWTDGFHARPKHDRWNATSFANPLVHGASLWCNLKRNSSQVNPHVKPPTVKWIYRDRRDTVYPS